MVHGIAANRSVNTARTLTLRARARARTSWCATAKAVRMFAVYGWRHRQTEMRAHHPTTTVDAAAADAATKVLR